MSLVQRGIAVPRVLLIGLAVTAVALVACGSDDGTVEAGGGATTTTDGSSETTTTTLSATTTTGAGQVDSEVSLTIQVSSDGGPMREATLTCAEAGASGTGFLAEASAAEVACELLTNNAQAKRRLVEGRPGGMLCTQIYGGPEVATVTGTIDGQRVNQTITRTDGCGIAEWQLLEPLIGPPAS
ncbi:MAG: hypothetical protein ACRD29_11735 [Acidimicrobiales bacterium]